MIRRRTLLAGAGLALSACGKERAITGGFTGASAERGHLLRQPPPTAAPAVTRKTGVLIAGGGIAGLSTARALRLAGVDDFTVLELEDRAGGNSRGMSVGGIACPMGAHYLPVPGDDASEVRDFLAEIGIAKNIAGPDMPDLAFDRRKDLPNLAVWDEALPEGIIAVDKLFEIERRVKTHIAPGIAAK